MSVHRLVRNITPALRFARNLTTATDAAERSSTVEIEKLGQDGQVMLIGINRPEKRNCVDPATAKQLFDAFTQFNSDPTSSVAVLYGKGGNFCAGFDLAALSNFDENLAILTKDGEKSEMGPMGPSRMSIQKPVIAAVSGYAVAGGMELALMCDLRVMEESAIMGIFCRRFGVPLIDGGTVRLPHLIGLSRALDLILTGRPVGAKEAHEMGLANRVVKTGTAVGAAVTLATEIAKFPQWCMNVDRRSAYIGAYSPFNEAMKREFRMGMKVIKEEAIPGATRFKEGVGRHGSFNLDKPSKL